MCAELFFYGTKTILNANFKDCYARFVNNKLVVGNSKMERTWHWTGKGFLTSSLLNKISGKEWCNVKPTIDSDWQLPSVGYKLPEGKILKLEAKENDDEKSLMMVATIVWFASPLLLFLRNE